MRREAAEIAKKEGLEEGKREILATFQRVALELMKSKLTRIPAAQRAAVQALDESVLASLISELGRAADAAEARAVVKRALTA